MPFGYDHKYTYSHCGYNLKITDMQAAVGLAQLDRLEGFALAFGAAVGRCYAAVFTTRGRGPRAEERVGATFAVVAGGLLERVEVAEVEDRAPHPEFPF